MIFSNKCCVPVSTRTVLRLMNSHDKGATCHMSAAQEQLRFVAMLKAQALASTVTEGAPQP